MAFMQPFNLDGFHSGGAADEQTTVIHLAMAQVGSVAGDQALERWLTEDDRQGVNRADRLLCRALLRALLVASTRVAAGRWHIAKTPGGKPIVSDSGGTRAPSVSISHSGGWSACALSFAGDVGIDIEQMRSDRDLPALAERAFGSGECAEVAASGCSRFYAIWTLREAMAKAQGIGLAMAADRKDRFVGVSDEGFQHLRVDVDSWQVMHQALDSGMSLALALRMPAHSAASPALRWWCAEPQPTSATS